MNGFTIAYEGFVPGEEGLREALTSTGNGYFCTRGAAEWEDARRHALPGHLLPTAAYNRETTMLGGRLVLNEDLVNLPNWLVLKLRIEGEDADPVRQCRSSVLPPRARRPQRPRGRKLRFRDRAGRETTLRSRRFVSMAHVHQAAIEWTVTPENWSGKVRESSRRSTGGS